MISQLTSLFLYFTHYVNNPIQFFGTFTRNKGYFTCSIQFGKDKGAAYTIDDPKLIMVELGQSFVSVHRDTLAPVNSHNGPASQFILCERSDSESLLYWLLYDCEYCVEFSQEYTENCEALREIQNWGYWVFTKSKPTNEAVPHIGRLHRQSPPRTLSTIIYIMTTIMSRTADVLYSTSYADQQTTTPLYYTTVTMIIINGYS